MAAAVTNPWKVTWGTFVCGDTTEKLIPNYHRLHKDHASFEVTFDVLIRGTSDATFATNCAEMESEFAKRRLKILFQVGASTVQTFDPADAVNTGLNSYARIDKVGTPGGDTDRSRLYTVTLGCELPSTDTSGRRDSTIVVEYDPAQKRTITISGVWTAITTVLATAQYAAQIDAWTTSVLDGLLPAMDSTKRELVGQRTERDDQDKTLRFSRTFREIIVAQPSGSLNHASIVDPTLAWARAIDASGDSGGGNVKRLQDIHAHFECWIDKTVTTDIQLLYTGTILPYLKTNLSTLYSPSSWAITAESYGLVPYTNQLTCDVTFRCAINPTDVIQSVTTQRIVENSGTVFTGKWIGKYFAKWADQGIGTRRRFAIRAVRVLGTIDPKERVGTGEGSVWGVFFNNPGGGSAAGTLQPGDPVPSGGGSGGAGGGRWVLVDNDSAATNLWLGKPGEEQIAVTDLVETTVEEWIVDGGSGVGGVSIDFSGAN